ncbi:ABC transporter ATP-binding protein [Tepidamorphus sp. 3E244]|uniref:ABC transporter ATP-binding protein n=1 Tax=Tepidamorphus sp. 3E244 TaxID=3385498 RepID=UPI0038FC9144
MTLLDVQGLTRTFGGVKAAQGVSFTVDAGQLVALIGPNGAGKTTTFNMVGGQLAPDAGRVMLDGRDVTGFNPRRISRAGVGRTFQITATFASLTVLENIQTALVGAARRHFDMFSRAANVRPDDALALAERVGLAAVARRPVGELAYGDLKRVELALALAASPKLLLMDEPTAGMAAGERKALMAEVANLVRDEGLGVLFTEHDMDAVFTHADHVIVLHQGEVVARGTPEEIRADETVRAIYLGTAA